MQEYERFKKAAEDIDALPRMERDIFHAHAKPPPLQRERPLPDVDLRELLLAFKKVIERSEMFTHHHIQREPLSVRERMSIVLKKVSSDHFIEFGRLFTSLEGRTGVVVTMLAILELLKEQYIELAQSEPFAPIYIRSSTLTGEESSP